MYYLSDVCPTIMSILRQTSSELEEKFTRKLYRALYHDRPTEVRQILQTNHIKNIDNMSDRGHTPLYHAVRWGSIDCTALLLEAGANPNIQETNHGWTPLIVCIRTSKNIDYVRLLLSYGADPRVHSFVGRNAWVYVNQLRRSHPEFSRECQQLFDDWRRSYVYIKRWKLNAKLKRRRRERNLLKYVLCRQNKNTGGLVESIIKGFLEHENKTLYF